jgi:hypothetical protein
MSWIPWGMSKCPQASRAHHIIKELGGLVSVSQQIVFCGGTGIREILGVVCLC